MYSYRSSSKDEDGADSSQWNEKLSPLKKQKIGFQSEEKNSLSQEKGGVDVHYVFLAANFQSIFFSYSFNFSQGCCIHSPRSSWTGCLLIK